MIRFNNNTSFKYRNLIFIVSILVLITFVVSGCIEITIGDIVIGGDWPMYKYDAGRTGSTDDFNFSTMNPLWRYDFEIFEEGGGSRVSAAASSNKVVIPTRYYVSCLGANDGSLIWRRYIRENYSSPIIYNEDVIISSTTGIHSFRLDDGSPIWVRNLSKEDYITPGISVPCAEDGKIYYGFPGKDDTEGYFYCFDANDGNTLWRNTLVGPVRTSPVVTDGKVFFGTDAGNFYCLNADNGDLVWKYFTGEIIRSSPAVYNNMVCFGCNDMYVYCLEKDSGKLIWKFKTEGANTAAPAISKEKVVVSSGDKYIYCLDIADGSQLWNYSIGNSTYTSPSIVGEKILIGLTNEIHCLDTEGGKDLWVKKLQDDGASTPLSIYQRKVYLRTTSFVFCFTLD